MDSMAGRGCLRASGRGCLGLQGFEAIEASDPEGGRRSREGPPHLRKPAKALRGRLPPAVADPHKARLPRARPPPRHAEEVPPLGDVALPRPAGNSSLGTTR